MGMGLAMLLLLYHISHSTSAICGALNKAVQFNAAFHLPDNLQISSVQRDKEFLPQDRLMSQHVRVTPAPPIPSTGSFTVELWFRVNIKHVHTFLPVLVSNKDWNLQSNKGFAIGLSATTSCIDVFANIGNGTTGVTAIGNTSCTAGSGRWHHLAVVFQRTASGGGGVQLLFNGALLPLFASATFVRFTGSVAPSLDLVFGQDGNGNFQGAGGTGIFSGIIDDVRLWSVARTSTQIAAGFKLGLSGNERNLLGYWSMNRLLKSIWGSTIVDEGPGRYHGKLVWQKSFAETAFHWDAGNCSKLTNGDSRTVSQYGSKDCALVDGSSAVLVPTCTVTMTSTSSATPISTMTYITPPYTPSPTPTPLPTNTHTVTGTGTPIPTVTSPTKTASVSSSVTYTCKDASTRSQCMQMAPCQWSQVRSSNECAMCTAVDASHAVCNAHGCADSTVTPIGCICFDDDVQGHWAGSNCSVCSDGWLGASCTIADPLTTLQANIVEIRAPDRRISNPERMRALLLLAVLESFLNISDDQAVFLLAVNRTVVSADIAGVNASQVEEMMEKLRAAVGAGTFVFCSSAVGFASDFSVDSIVFPDADVVKCGSIVDPPPFIGLAADTSSGSDESLWLLLLLLILPCALLVCLFFWCWANDREKRIGVVRDNASDTDSEMEFTTDVGPAGAKAPLPPLNAFPAAEGREPSRQLPHLPSTTTPGAVWEHPAGVQTGTPTPGGPVPAQPSKLECTKGHKLVVLDIKARTSFAAAREGYGCASCNRLYRWVANGTPPAARCESCNYNVCISCFQSNSGLAFDTNTKPDTPLNPLSAPGRKSSAVAGVATPELDGWNTSVSESPLYGSNGSSPQPTMSGQLPSLTPEIPGGGTASAVGSLYGSSSRAATPALHDASSRSANGDVDRHSSQLTNLTHLLSGQLVAQTNEYQRRLNALQLQIQTDAVNENDMDQLLRHEQLLGDMERIQMLMSRQQALGKDVESIEMMLNNISANAQRAANAPQPGPRGALKGSAAAVAAAATASAMTSDANARQMADIGIQLAQLADANEELLRHLDATSSNQEAQNQQVQRILTDQQLSFQLQLSNLVEQVQLLMAATTVAGPSSGRTNQPPPQRPGAMRAKDTHTTPSSVYSRPPRPASATLSRSVPQRAVSTGRTPRSASSLGITPLRIDDRDTESDAEWNPGAAAGLSVAELAHQLNVERQTTRNHMQDRLDSLRASSQAPHTPNADAVLAPTPSLSSPFYSSARYGPNGMPANFPPSLSVPGPSTSGPAGTQQGFNYPSPNIFPAASPAPLLADPGSRTSGAPIVMKGTSASATLSGSAHQVLAVPEVPTVAVMGFSSPMMAGPTATFPPSTTVTPMAVSGMPTNVYVQYVATPQLSPSAQQQQFPPQFPPQFHPMQQQPLQMQPVQQQGTDPVAYLPSGGGEGTVQQPQQQENPQYHLHHVCGKCGHFCDPSGLCRVCLSEARTANAPATQPRRSPRGRRRRSRSRTRSPPRPGRRAPSRTSPMKQRPASAATMRPGSTISSRNPGSRSSSAAGNRPRRGRSRSRSSRSRSRSGSGSPKTQPKSPFSARAVLVNSSHGEGSGRRVGGGYVDLQGSTDLHALHHSGRSDRRSTDFDHQFHNSGPKKTGRRATNH